MKRLVTSGLGGFPFVLDDLRFIESGILEAFKGVVSPYVGSLNQLVLSGCSMEVVGSNIVVSEGFFYHQNEIYYVPSQTHVDESKPYQYFDVNIAYDPSGNKQFQNGTTVQTYQVRTMKLIQSDILPTGFINFTDLENLHHRSFIAHGFQDNVGWTDLPGSSYVYPVPDGRPQFSKDVNGYVHFRGNWNHDDPDSSFIVGILPIGFRPELDIRFNYVSINIHNPQVQYSYEIVINATTGVIDITGNYFPVTLNCISFPSFKAM